MVKESNQSGVGYEVQINDDRAKEKHADWKSSIQVGDSVLIKQRKFRHVLIQFRS